MKMNHITEAAQSCVNALIAGLCVIVLVFISGCRPEQLARNLSANNWSQGYVPGSALQPAYQQPVTQQVNHRQGVIVGAKGANVRSGPGTQYAPIGTIANGAIVGIMGQQGKWYQVDANINGILKQGWVYSTLLQERGNTHYTANPSAGNSQSNIVHMGYSKDFLVAKQQLIAGQGMSLSQQIAVSGATEDDFWKQDDEFLRALEYGTITLDLNNTSAAVENLSSAERILEERESSSIVGEFLQNSGGWLGEIFGQGALAPYEGEGYEKVLMLNYLSIAYLLDGNRKAYNVARRSIDIQNIERKKFEIRKAKAEEKLREQESSSSIAGSGMDAVFNSFNSRVKAVDSAYVNPFGFYVTGMIQEYESYQERSLRDNARISYEKALELNPDSKVLQQAVKDMKKSVAPSGKQLLHVVAADGFVPEKKVFLNQFHYGGINIPLKLPIYEPGESKVSRIEVQTTGGKRLARLSPVADVEALCIRHQKDMEVFRNLRVALAFSSTVVEKSFLKQLGPLGNWVGDYHDNFKEPDTRSWMTLPATIQAARMYLPRNIHKVRLISYGHSGKVLARQTIALQQGKPNFIYARSIDSVLNAHAANDMWLQAGL